MFFKTRVPVRKLIDGSVKLSLNDFFMDATACITKYTETPSMRFDVARLVNGLPPFEIMANKLTQSREKKIILLPEEISDELKVLFDELSSLGFIFYRYTEDGGYEVTGGTHELLLSESTPSAIDLSRILDIEIDRVLDLPSNCTLEEDCTFYTPDLFCDPSEIGIGEEQFSAFLNSKANVITHLKLDKDDGDYVAVTKDVMERLNRLHYLSLSAFDFDDTLYIPGINVSELHLDRCNLNDSMAEHIYTMPLKKLCISDYKWIDFSRMKHLGKLEYLDLCYTSVGPNYSLGDDDSIVFDEPLDEPPSLEPLFTNAVNLKYLKIDHPDVEWPKIKFLNFPELISIHFSKMSLSAEELAAILYAAPKLKRLTLESSIIEGFRGNNEFFFAKKSFPALQRLKIVAEQESPIEIECIQNLIAASPNLQEIIINGKKHDNPCGYNLDRLTPSHFNLKNLKRLDLSYNNISTYTLQEFLSQTTNRSLKKLILHKVSSLSLDELDLTSFNTTEVEYKENPKTYQNDSDSESEDYFGNEYGGKTQYIDADTAREVKFPPIKRLFIGHPVTPSPNSVRMEHFSGVALNSKMKSINNPFILTAAQPPQDTEKYRVTVARSSTSLKPVYDTLIQSNPPHAFYLGKFNLLVSNKWRALPSVVPNETLEHIYTAAPIELEFTRSDSGFYYYRCLNYPRAKDIRLEVILSAPCVNTEEKIRTLPDKAQALIRYCSAFKKGQLILDNKSKPNAQEYLNALSAQRVGSCRHRSVVFALAMQRSFPDYPVRLISNKVHLYPEVFNPHTHTWVTCDLGGYPTALTIDDGQFNVSKRESNQYEKLTLEYI